MGLVYQATQSYQRTGERRHRWTYSYGDIFAWGYLGLRRAVELFDPEVGKFSTYAKFWIVGWVRKGLVGAMRPLPPAAYHEVAAWQPRSDSDAFQFAEAACDHRGLAEAVARLPPRERACIEGRLAGLTQRELAEQAGVSRSLIAALQVRAIELLRTELPRAREEMDRQDWAERDRRTAREHQRDAFRSFFARHGGGRAREQAERSAG